MWSVQFFHVRSWALHCRLPVSRSETSQKGVWWDAAHTLVDAVIVKFGGPLCCQVGSVHDSHTVDKTKGKMQNYNHEATCIKNELTAYCSLRLGA
jgi:hypothetical protein